MTRQKKVNGLQLPSGLPLIVVEGDDDLKAIRESGLSVTYFLGAKPGAKKTDLGVPRVYRCVNNLVGFAISLVEDDDLDLLEVEEHAWFNLPPIPQKIIRDLDHFFRMVDAKLGTESIVLLTFNPTFIGKDNASEGWGVLVPKQANTAGSCNYDPASIVDDKDEGVMIAGSVHSHPGMAAFASHTDVGDQANFDGIHITFGWKKGSRTTDYHIELQMGGGRFTFNEENAFEGEPEGDIDDRVGTWVERVEKEKPKSYGYGGAMGSMGWGGYHDWQGQRDYVDPKTYRSPEGVPDPRKEGVVVNVLVGEQLCPVCRTKLEEADRGRRRCTMCLCFLAMPNEGPAEVIKARWNHNYQGFGSPELKHSALHKHAWHWVRWQEKNDKGIMQYKEKVEKVDLWDLEEVNKSLTSGKA